METGSFAPRVNIVAAPGLVSVDCPVHPHWYERAKQYPGYILEPDLWGTSAHWSFPEGQVSANWVRKALVQIFGTDGTHKLVRDVTIDLDEWAPSVLSKLSLPDPFYAFGRLIATHKGTGFRGNQFVEMGPGATVSRPLNFGLRWQPKTKLLIVDVPDTAPASWFDGPGIECSGPKAIFPLQNHPVVGVDLAVESDESAVTVISTTSVPKVKPAGLPGFRAMKEAARALVTTKKPSYWEAAIPKNEIPSEPRAVSGILSRRGPLLDTEGES